MKDLWLNRYEEAAELRNGEYVEVLTGFNANIDVLYKFQELETDLTDTKPKNLDEVSNLQDLKSLVLYCKENGINKEVKGKSLQQEFKNGEENIGGQGGIMANFLSNFRNSVIFYTPFLSEKLSEKLNNEILYPLTEDNQFLLKNVRDAHNTDRTKKNLIIEYSGEDTGRLIVSDTLKGFGPYFRKGVEENIDKLDENLDRVLLSGFQNIDGNKEAKLKKARDQLDKIKTPIHLEYVDTDEDTVELIMDNIFDKVDSLGLDEFELQKLANMMDIEVEEEKVSLGHGFQIGKNTLEKFGLSRFHVHTYNYHLIVASEDYPIDCQKIRESMLFGELCAITMADEGRIPGKDDLTHLEMKNKHVHMLDDLEDFGHFFNLENFAETGIAELDGYKVVAIPTIIHEDPDRLVGMGDIISAGTFVGELK